MTLSSGDFCFFVEGAGARQIEGPYDERTAQNLLRAIRHSWQELSAELRGSSTRRLKRHDENELNEMLCNRLNTLLDGDVLPYFSSAVFQDVILEGKQRSVRKSLAPRMPDLQIRLCRVKELGIARSKAVLCIECKLLIASHHIREYVNNGMHRFVRGDYSPHLSLGIMLGYASSKHVLPHSLERYLKRAKRSSAKQCRSSMSPFGRGDGACHITEHRRARISHTKKIKLMHIWLPHPKPDLI